VIRELGCGSCSPRGFYGSFLQHLELERALATFTGTEEALLYPSGAVVMTSVIPAMLTR